MHVSGAIGTSPEQLSPKCEKSPPGEAVHDKSMGVANTQEEMDGHVEDESATQAAMNAAAARRLRRFKIFLVTGDFEKQLTGRRALAGKFSGATVGAMHSHLLRKSHKLVDVLAPGARVLVESAKNILQVCRCVVHHSSALPEFTVMGAFVSPFIISDLDTPAHIRHLVGSCYAV